MYEYQVKLTLHGVGSSDAQVRLWIDTELGGDLDCEQEVELVSAEEASWSGLFSAKREAFMYRVGICATPGTAWSLSVRDARANGRELLFDSDMLVMAKEWLIGSCDRVGPQDNDNGLSC
jgi:hypothetical protein